MLNHKLLLPLALVMLSSAAHAAPRDVCDLAQIKSDRKLDDILSNRSVEIIALAGKADWRSEDRLAWLVVPTASFSLGASDVGRPLVSGPAGARALATLMGADSYSFPGWDFMEQPTDGCVAHTVTIVFANTTAKRRSEVQFSYLGGRLVAAKGWEQSYKSGPLDRPQGQ